MQRRDLLGLIGEGACGSAMYLAMSALGHAAESTYGEPIKLDGTPRRASVLVLGAGVTGIVATELQQVTTCELAPSRCSVQPRWPGRGKPPRGHPKVKTAGNLREIWPRMSSDELSFSCRHGVQHRCTRGAGAGARRSRSRS